MKKIIFPETVKCQTTNMAGDVVQKFEIDAKDFLTTALKTYGPLGQGEENIEKGAALKAKVREANGEILLHDDQLATVKAAIQACAWNPELAEFFLPFFKAVKDAKEA